MTVHANKSVTAHEVSNNLLYRDYNKYDELISDLRQIKLFYTKDPKQ